MNEDLKEIFEYYCKYNKQLSQDELVSMLREIQEVCGGILTSEALQCVCNELGVKENYINTIIKFVPDIKTEKVLHRLFICGGVNCRSNNSGEIHDYIRKKYKVSPGETCEKYGFAYNVCGCLKHCAHGPNIKWNRKIYSKVTREMLDKLIGKK